LQRALGNQAVQRLLRANSEGLEGDYGTSATDRFAHDFTGIPIYDRAPMTIQTKLKLNSPGDIYEQEADRIADRVMREPDAPIQRACACGGECQHCKEEHSNKRRMQAKHISQSASEATVAPPIVSEVLNSPGQPLAAYARAAMESRFGHDFSNVRVHFDPLAAESAQTLNARAYTVGHNIVFGANQYATATDAGQHLLAHELTHVIQQSESARPLRIQRSITLTDPGGTPPQPPGAMGPFPTKAFTLGGWLHTLCPSGNWDVNAGGVVDSVDRATFCGPRPAKGHRHHSNSAQQTSCGCLCELTAPGSRTVEVQIDENLRVGASVIPLIPQGEAATVHRGPTDKASGFTGREHVGITGAGATKPLAGAGRTQTVPDPPWIIFGHEVCGHARLQAGVMGPTGVGHSTTRKGDATTVDIENRIRREHSTLASSLGIRRGNFNALDAMGNFVNHLGAVFVARSGHTIAAIAVRCGIPVANMLDYIWRSDGKRITAATRDQLLAGEELLIEGIDWHEVIKGEDMSSLAKMWGVPLASLRRANPQIPPPFVLHSGDRLLIPSS